ncbi:DNA polymerase [Phtheirospermum japonicum]|uniref:DNA-directed DNA polymerase n=1 Tax=Phtheirospermum japonicum TaxID=374723 RepID=A0A830D2W4_9LAMI|nr:DNA polymerase [Phtheirospermum japonicum]
MKYYDEENNYIHIPNKNADSFIRSGYYGGHTDAYKKYGENLYYYDVNSLYPFIMKEYSFPADDSWELPQNTAVHISAAITANARILMYPYISRDDCYYTDTDSIILGNPLPEDEISTSVLGKFKLEDNIQKGFFLAAKAYAYTTYDDANNVIKFKGPAKDYVNLDWFQDQYEKPERRMQVTVKKKFSINWKKLEVFEKKTLFNLGIKQNTKRINLPEGNTKPFCLNDFSAANNYSIRVIRSLLKRCNLLEAEMKKYLIDRLNNKDKEMNEREKGKVTKVLSCKTKDGVIEKKEDLESINNTEIESSLKEEESDKTDDLKPDT